MYGSKNELEDAESKLAEHHTGGGVQDDSFCGFFERHFQLQRNNTTIGREVRAGIATFLTMSYIVIINARLVGSKHGIPRNDVMLGTALSSAVASFVCGYFGNFPFALAPGLGLSAYLSSGLVHSAPPAMSMSSSSLSALDQEISTSDVGWRTALTACAISGVFQMLMANKLSRYLMTTVPHSVQVGTVVGMGLLIAFVGLQELDFVDSQHVKGGPLLRVGDGAYSTNSLVSLCGLLLVTLLSHHNFPGSVLLSVLITTLLSIFVLQTSKVPSHLVAFPQFQQALFALDFVNLNLVTHLPAIFSFVLVGVVDVAGVVMGLSHVLNLEKDENGIPTQSSWVFFAAGLGTLVGALCGSTPVIVHLESAAGLTEGGRTGLTACVTALLFLCSVWIGPLLESVPISATSPVLFFVGSLMCRQLQMVDWEDSFQALPAFTTFILIPLTFSVPNGVFFGVVVASTLQAVDFVVKRCMYCCGRRG